MRGYFITGTGTGVGKTYVTAALARLARERGQRVFAFKPIETGCTWTNGALIGADQTILCAAAGDWQQGPFRGVYQFEPPVAPAVAARSKSVRIDLAEIERVMRAGARDADFVLVEGAGGWRVPINDTEDMSSLAASCGLPVLIVGTAGLGTINHCLLTIEAVTKTSTIAGVVLSSRAEDDAELTESNVREISGRWSGRMTLSNALECFV